MDFAITYISIFIASIFLALPILLFLIIIILFLGVIVSYLESWKIGNSLYWTFITATTVGYGDIKPSKSCSKFLSIIIAVFGILLTGMMLAISVESAIVSFSKHVTQERIERVKIIFKE